MPLAPFLLGLVGSLVGRVLASLGFAVVTIVGVDAVIDELKDKVVEGANSLPGDVYQLFLLAGGGIGIGMIFGAISFRLTLWSIQKAVRVVGIRS
jgi:cell division protein FtsX